MYSKTSVSLSSVAIAALVLVFASGPIVSHHQALAVVIVHGHYGGYFPHYHHGYYGHYGGYFPHYHHGYYGHYGGYFPRYHHGYYGHYGGYFPHYHHGYYGHYHGHYGHYHGHGYIHAGKTVMTPHGIYHKGVTVGAY